MVSALWRSIGPHLPLGTNSRAVRQTDISRLCPAVLVLQAVRASIRHKLSHQFRYSYEKHARKSDGRLLACGVINRKKR